METLRSLLLPREYSTVKFVRVQNARLAFFHRFVFLLVLCYVLLWQLVAQKGYQRADLFSASALIKVKGVATSKASAKVYDANDLVVPALEQAAVFIQTNFHPTPNQRRQTCSGIDRSGGIPAYVSEVCDCAKDTKRCARGTCRAGVPTANGVTTGACVDTNSSDRRVSVRGLGWMCEIRAWCPLEAPEEAGGNVLALAGNFTVFVRVDGKFPVLAPHKPLSNFRNRSLVWNRNLFYVADIVAAAATGSVLAPVALGRHREGLQVLPQRLDYAYFLQAAEKGAEVIVDMEFNCDLDFDVDGCQPQFSFSRVDGGKGFNYRSTNEYYTTGDNGEVRHWLCGS